MISAPLALTLIYLKFLYKLKDVRDKARGAVILFRDFLRSREKSDRRESDFSLESCFIATIDRKTVPA